MQTHVHAHTHVHACIHNKIVALLIEWSRHQGTTQNCENLKKINQSFICNFHPPMHKSRFSLVKKSRLWNMSQILTSSTKRVDQYFKKWPPSHLGEATSGLPHSPLIIHIRRSIKF